MTTNRAVAQVVSVHVWGTWGRRFKSAQPEYSDDTIAMDTVSASKRSKIMSKIKSKDSKIETALRKRLWKYGLRYRKNSTRYFGKPDIIFPKYKTVIFIDSCFWHGCSEHCRMPKSNVDYWENKITKNKTRDCAVTMHYRKINWQVIRIWEHDLYDIDCDMIHEQIIRYCPK